MSSPLKESSTTTSWLGEDENVFSLHEEMSQVMVKNVTVERNNKDLKATLDKLKRFRERYQHISLADRTRFANQTYIFANQFRYMLELAIVITKCALARDESRGSHFKRDFPNRDDEHWLKQQLLAITKTNLTSPISLWICPTLNPVLVVM